jgi:hypothetical protein
MSTEGELVGSELVFASGATNRFADPVLVWNGLNYGLLMREFLPGYYYTFHFVLISAEGRIIHPLAPLNDRAGLYNSSTQELLWNGSNFVWLRTEQRDGISVLLLQFVSEEGELFGEEVRLSDTVSTAALTWTGTEYGLVYDRSSAVPSRAYFQRLNEDGEPLGEPIMLIESVNSRSRHPDVVWGDDGYVVFLLDNRVASDQGLRFVRLTEEGLIVGQGIVTWVPIGSDRMGYQELNIVLGNRDYALLWTTVLYPDLGLYFRRIGGCW